MLLDSLNSASADLVWEFHAEASFQTMILGLWLVWRPYPSSEWLRAPSIKHHCGHFSKKLLINLFWKKCQRFLRSHICILTISNIKPRVFIEILFKQVITKKNHFLYFWIKSFGRNYFGLIRKRFILTFYILLFTWKILFAYSTGTDLGETGLS